MVRLSVVICTLDRAPLLAGCLDAVVADRPLDGSVEVIVVDNGSTDHTSAVVAARPSIVYVREEERGLSRARNTGLSVAHTANGFLIVAGPDVPHITLPERPTVDVPPTLLRLLDWPIGSRLSGSPIDIALVGPAG